jgi:hypothetical protein
MLRNYALEQREKPVLVAEEPVRDQSHVKPVPELNSRPTLAPPTHWGSMSNSSLTSTQASSHTRDSSQEETRWLHDLDESAIDQLLEAMCVRSGQALKQ